MRAASSVLRDENSALRAEGAATRTENARLAAQLQQAELQQAELQQAELQWAAAGAASRGRHCHSTLSLNAIVCHSLGICTLILLSLLSFSAKMTVSPLVRRGRLRDSESCRRRHGEEPGCAEVGARGRADGPLG